MKFVEVEPATKCWLWTGSRCKRKGHGKFWWNGQCHWAHRVSYLIFNGPLNDSQDVGHLIPEGLADPVSHDVNPDHLELQNVSDNVAECNRRRTKPKDDIPF